MIAPWLFLALVSMANVAAAFDRADVAAKAQALAREPFQSSSGQVPHWLLKINYDQWRDIRFRPQHALRKHEHLPFQIQFFHPGLYYERTVAINVVQTDAVRPVEFSTDQFDAATGATEPLRWSRFRPTRTSATMSI